LDCLVPSLEFRCLKKVQSNINNVCYQFYLILTSQILRDPSTLQEPRVSIMVSVYCVVSLTEDSPRCRVVLFRRRNSFVPLVHSLTLFFGIPAERVENAASLPLMVESPVAIPLRCPHIFSWSIAHTSNICFVPIGIFHTQQPPSVTPTWTAQAQNQQWLQLPFFLFELGR
jgi:hypothetical protein